MTVYQTLVETTSLNLRTVPDFKRFKWS